VAGGGLCVVIDGWEADHSDIYERQRGVLDELLTYLKAQLSVDSWEDLVMEIIGEVGGVGVPPWVIVITFGVAELIYRIINNPDDRLGSYPVLIPNVVFEEWKLQKDIVANNSLAEGTRLLAARGGPSWSNDPMQQTLQALIQMGAFNERTIQVPMDNRDENHGFYEVVMRARLS
jgi:hypothetical protein